MGQITGARVAYRRTIQPEPYESKTAEVEFTIVIEPGEDAGTAVADALADAKAEVFTALGLTKQGKKG